MKHAPACILAVSCLLLVSPHASAQRVVYLVRHAEKGGAGSIDAEVPLTQFGEQQAQRLADRLADAGISAVYYSRFDPLIDPGLGLGPGELIRRTKDTAAPLVKRLREQRAAVADHELIYPRWILNWRAQCGVMGPFAAEAVQEIRRMQKDRPAEIILIVGHENTVPAIIREFAALQHISLPPDTDLGGPLEFMGAKEFGLLYRIDLDEKTAEKFLRVERYALASSTAMPSKVIYPPEAAKSK